jgi:hypothetical protein
MHDVVTESQDTTELCDVYLVVFFVHCNCVEKGSSWQSAGILCTSLISSSSAPMAPLGTWQKGKSEWEMMY